MTLLQALQGLLVMLDGRLQLPNVFGSTLPKGSLGLSIALFALFGGGIDLDGNDINNHKHR